ncbi:MAG: DUF2281 domain-containing protein [Flavobacteriales bacterium]|jgi:hypothetical protein|nr:DUF2281 domain-containing protein [Flavobacteriales bacterium]MBP9160440.1 DUF2281 domain-containing protein [Flavobacteriales bacterium]MCI1753064.1 DUF2281 domain-containing protein [Flavobacteriales bacterium]
MPAQDHYIQLDSLPEEVRKKAIAFIASLMEQWERKKPTGQSPNDDAIKPRVFGIAKGMATICKDFDDPLDDFKEYM